MALKIIWSDEAKESLARTLAYLEENWTEKELTSFSKILEKQLNIVSHKPRTYKKSERLLGTRECLLTKHNSLFYVADKDTLHIVTLLDNRQEPQKLLAKNTKH
jgi:plasmid stabilization system protein ParE